MKRMKSMISMLLAAVLLLSGGAQALAAGTVTPTQASGAIFGAKFEGDQVEGTGEVVDGVYRIAAAKTDGEAWHVKLECNYPTVAGHEYRVTYRFTSDVAGKVKFGDFQEFKIEKGENELTGLVIAKDSTTYLDLQLGMLPSFTMDFTQVEVWESQDETEYEDALPQPIRFDAEDAFYERHDQGYSPDFTATADSVTVNYYSSGWDAGVWKARLYVNTGMVPQPGNKYRISADVRCEKDMDFEVLLNKEEQEKGYGALYGRHMTAGETSTVEHILTIPSSGFADGELVLQFSLGNAPEEADITISNVHVDKVIDHYTDLLPTLFALDQEVFNGKSRTVATPTDNKDVPLTNFSYSGTDTVYKTNDDDYTVTLTEAADSATLSITQAPEDRGAWKARLFAETGVVLEAGTTYRIKYDLASTGNQAVYEVVFNGDTEGAYGFDKNRSLTAGGTDHMETLVTPDASHGPLTLLFQLGKTDTTAGNTVTLSGLSVEKVSAEYAPAKTVTLSTGTEGKVWEEASNGAEVSASVSGSTATLTVTKAHDSTGGIWSHKLFVKTGVVPETGARYRVSATLAATGETGMYNILYQNAAGGNYEGNYDLKTPGKQSSDFTVTASDCGELVLVFELGNAAEGNAITVSDLEVCKLTASGEMTPVTLTGFAYPESEEDSTENNSFDLGAEPNPNSAAALTGDGSSATAAINGTDGEDWRIKLYAKPGLELTAGETYTVGFDVAATNRGGVSYEACFKNVNHTGEGDAEKVFGTETISADSQSVTHTFTAAESGTMEILLKLGALPVGAEVTVSNVTLKKTTTTFIPQDLPTTFGYPSVTEDTTADNAFFVEVNPDSGAEARLTGNGSSATATVTTPKDDWHVKFYAKPGYALTAGNFYTVSFDVTNANGCQVCYKNVNHSGGGDAELAFGSEWVSSNSQTVTHRFVANENGTMEILLKIGALAANTAVTISNVSITESTTYAVPFGGPGGWIATADDGAASYEDSTKSATVNTHYDNPDDSWKIKLYVSPRDPADNSLAMWIGNGKTYWLSFDAVNAAGCPVCYNNPEHTGGGDSELVYGTEYVYSDNQTVNHYFTAGENGRMEIILKLGHLNAGTTVSVSNIRVYEIHPAKSVALPASFYPTTTPGAVQGNSFALNVTSGEAKLTGTDSSAAVNITTAGDITLTADTDYTLTAGENYQIEMNVAGADGSTVSFVNAGTGTADFGTQTVSSGTVTHTVTPSADGSSISSCR